jgi:putative transposase
MTLVPEAAWREAHRRAEVVRPLAARDRRPRELVQAAAATLGLSERQTYALLRRCREADGDLTALLPGQSSGGRNKPRVAPASEAALEQIIRELYLTPQKLTASQVVREVIGRCTAQDLRAPSSAPTTSWKTASSHFCCRPGKMAPSLAAFSPVSRRCCRCANPLVLDCQRYVQ